MSNISIVGAGLAGCEAALTLAYYGHTILLHEQKPSVVSGAYHMPTFAELVCNNSICSLDVHTPLGLLCHELTVLQSSLINIAQSCRLDDPCYFAIDKKRFSTEVTTAIKECPRITVINDEVHEIPDADYTIIATGPASNNGVLKSISEQFGVEAYHFSDASSAVVDIRSINLEDKHLIRISDDLYAVQIPDENLIRFCNKLSEFYTNKTPREGNDLLQECQSIESLANQGVEVLNRMRFTHPGLGSNCLLLRRENGLENGFIIVGSMTTLRHAEQRIAFSMLPGFSNVRFQKYGRMHQNTFVDSPGRLNSFYQIIGTNKYIIGQLSGIDGYIPAISSGHIAALHIHFQNELPPPPKNTMIGGLANYISNIQLTDFQPMCASYSLLFGGNNLEKEQRAQQSIVSYKEIISHMTTDA